MKTQPITRNKAKAIIMFELMKDLFKSTCVIGTIGYFILIFYNFEITFGKCFVAVFLMRSIYNFMIFYIKRDEIDSAIDKSLEKFNNNIEE